MLRLISYRYLQDPSDLADLVIAVFLSMLLASTTNANESAEGTMPTTTYQIEYDGTLAGSEDTLLTHEDQTNRISSHVMLTLPQGDVSLSSDFKSVLKLDSRNRPVHYSVLGRLHGQKINLQVIFQDNYAVASGRNISVHYDDLVVLDNLITMHYEILLQRYRAKSRKDYRFWAFIPQAMVEVPAMITFKGQYHAQNKGETMHLDRFKITIGSTFFELLATPQGQVVRLEIPAQKLAFARNPYTDLEEIRKKIEPAAVSQVITEEISFKSQEVTLSGAIRRSEAKQGDLPGVLLISGSGQQDRDGHSKGKAIDLQYRAIAEGLAEAGRVVLSYDDRGVGLSENSCEHFSFSDDVRDAEAALLYLMRNKNVDPQRVIVVGHSSGAVVAAQLVGRQRGICGIVLMGAPGRPLEEILVSQMKKLGELNNATHDMQVEALRRQSAYLEFIKHYQPGQKVPPDMRTQEPQFLWFKELLDHDPLSDYAALRCPVLIMHGDKDLQVSPDDADKIFNALKYQNKKDSRLKIYPDLDHLFMPSTDGNIANYYDRDRSLSTQVLNDLTQWISMVTQ
jgi:pimeloyl-ACP methyl ester carboxylesterase